MTYFPQQKTPFKKSRINNLHIEILHSGIRNRCDFTVPDLLRHNHITILTVYCKQSRWLLGHEEMKLYVGYDKISFLHSLWKAKTISTNVTDFFWNPFRNNCHLQSTGQILCHPTWFQHHDMLRQQPSPPIDLENVMVSTMETTAFELWVIQQGRLKT